MPLQDLTPQLRTRLSRMERAVGWFVLVAAALLVFGFGYYVHHTAQRKGWFVTKATYFTYVDRATGLKVGDPVKLMGFEVGQITRITAEDPGMPYNVYVEFEIKAPFYGYIWTDGSRARVAAADFLGKRELEVTKGTDGCATYLFHPLKEIPLAEADRLPSPEKWRLAEDIYDPNAPEILLHAQKAALVPAVVAQLRALGRERVWALDTREERNYMTAVWNGPLGRYEHFGRTNKYWMRADEAPAVTEQLERLVAQVEKALPGILALTNSLERTLDHAAVLTSNLNAVALDTRPAVSNLTALSGQLRGQGALGAWLFTAGGQADLERSLAAVPGTLTNANSVLTNVDASLTVLTAELARSLENLAGITSNLNNQVQANTNLLSAISDAVVHADELMQGLKRHWLLRSAFRAKATNAPPALPAPTWPRSSRDAGRR